MRTPITLVALAACVVGQAIMPAIAQSPQPGITTVARAYAVAVAEAARRFGLSEDWIWAVMRAESYGNPRAVSTAGAMGLMQIMPSTWTQLTARYQLGVDPFDPRANILAGAAYLREMVDRYGDLATAVAAYNAGPGRVDEANAGGRPLKAVTLAYVAGITSAVGAPNSLSVVVPESAAAPDWHRAALFIARADDRIAAPASTPDAPPKPMPPASPDAAFPTPKPPVDRLFVPVGGRIER